MPQGTLAAIGSTIDGMDITPFNAPVSSKGRAKVIKIRDGTEVAARHFVYKLYDTTDGQPMQWRVLHGMGSQRPPFPGQLSADGSFSRT